MAERTIWWSLWALLLLNISPTADAADSHSKQHDATVARAVRLLPTRPEKVVIVDVDQVPALRAKLSHAEAFVTHGERVVYLRMQGQMLQQATRTGGFFDYALAAIIWHEMAHIDGADEAAALAAEQALWRQYIVQRRVDAAAGLRYLSTICSHEAAPSGRENRPRASHCTNSTRGETSQIKLGAASVPRATTSAATTAQTPAVDVTRVSREMGSATVHRSLKSDRGAQCSPVSSRL